MDCHALEQTPELSVSEPITEPSTPKPSSMEQAVEPAAAEPSTVAPSGVPDEEDSGDDLENSPLRETARHLVAVLFAGGGPVKIEEVARALGVPSLHLEGPLEYLRINPPLGLRVQRQGEELELVTDPGSARCVETLLGLDRPVKLSRAALETLAIVAYRQPVTRGDVEAIRGVNSDSAVTTLLNRGLIAEVGKRETVGRPTLYGSTPEFLQHLGLDSMEDLPALPE